MTKTIDALKLAEEALEGWKEYDTWTDQQMWNDDDEEALAAIREVLAEQEKQEPVASYKDAPRTIYLQTGCDDPDPFNCGCSFNEWGDVSWCADKIHDTDIPYVRADYAAPLSVEAAVLAEREACAKVCMKQQYDLKTRQTFAAAIRARGNK